MSPATPQHSTPDSGRTSRPDPGSSDRPPGRGIILAGAISVALISTAAAYVAMTGFGRDVLKMGSANAYAFAGVFELSLVTVALMAREAAQQNRPAQTLLTLTWGLSGASGTFSAVHELYLGHGPVAAVFRFTVPLLAALMWHLALVGDRHLAMERSWNEIRMGARMHALLSTRVEWRRARDHALRRRTRWSRRKLERAQRRYWRAEATALRAVAPGAMREQITQWVDAFSAVSEGTRAADRLPITLPDVNEVFDGVPLPAPVAEQVTSDVRPAISPADMQAVGGTGRSVDAPDVAPAPVPEPVSSSPGVAYEDDDSPDTITDVFGDNPWSDHAVTASRVRPPRSDGMPHGGTARPMVSVPAATDTRHRVTSRLSQAARAAAEAAPHAAHPGSRGVSAPVFSHNGVPAEPSEAEGTLLDRIPFPENIPDPIPDDTFPEDIAAELSAEMPEEPSQAAVYMWSKGARVPDIAQKLGVSQRTVYRWTADARD